MTWLIAILVSTLLAVTVLAVLAARTPRFAASPTGLEIGNSLFGRTIAIARLRPEAARLVDLRRSPELRPRLRTFGIGWPANPTGWFRLANGEKALLFLDDSGRALYMPTDQGYALLLGADDPQALLGTIERVKRIAPDASAT